MIGISNSNDVRISPLSWKLTNVFGQSKSYSNSINYNLSNAIYSESFLATSNSFCCPWSHLWWRSVWWRSYWLCCSFDFILSVNRCTAHVQADVWQNGQRNDFTGSRQNIHCISRYLTNCVIDPKIHPTYISDPKDTKTITLNIRDTVTTALNTMDTEQEPFLNPEKMGCRKPTSCLCSQSV